MEIGNEGGLGIIDTARAKGLTKEHGWLEWGINGGGRAKGWICLKDRIRGNLRVGGKAQWGQGK